jgi:hypothetical protein
VRHQHHRRAHARPQVRQQLEHPLAGGGVEVAGRLVRQQDRRLGDEGPRQRDPLLLTTRELTRQVMPAVRQADRRQQRLRPRARVAVAAQLERHRDVLLRGQRRDQVERLEHEAERAAAQAGQRVLAEADQLLSPPASRCRWSACRARRSARATSTCPSPRAP